jgi:hypothetical protein
MMRILDDLCCEGVIGLPYYPARAPFLTLHDRTSWLVGQPQLDSLFVLLSIMHVFGFPQRTFQHSIVRQVHGFIDAKA